MKLREIEYSKGYTINLGNFESERVDISVRATLDEGDDREESLAELVEWVESKIQAVTGVSS